MSSAKPLLRVVRPPEAEEPEPEPQAPEESQLAAMTKEQRFLYESAAKLVEPEAKKVAPRVGYMVSLKDLIQEGHEGLIKAAQRFDATRGTDWISYAKKCVHYAMFDSVRSEVRGSLRLALEARHAGRGPLERFVPTGDVATDSEQQTHTQLHDFMGLLLSSMLVATARAIHNRRADEQIEACEAEQGLYATIRSLAERDRTLIEKYAFEEEDLTVIAKERGVSHKTIVRSRDRVMKLIHARLHGRDIKEPPPFLQGPAPRPGPAPNQGPVPNQGPAPKPAPKKRHE